MDKDMKHLLAKKDSVNDLKDFMSKSKGRSFHQRLKMFDGFLQSVNKDCRHTYGRTILSETDREVIIKDPFTGKTRKLIMFASNNYLGFAGHRYVKTKVKDAIDKYGAGIAGPPLLNGYTNLMRELEERLAGLKEKESAMIFSTGYSANLGIVTALANQNDMVIYDELSHASFLDAIRMAHVDAAGFGHNNLEQLLSLCESNKHKYKNLFLGIEGVYSMDGDLAPLDRIMPISKKYNAVIMLDDAHGTGILGDRGSGTAEHFSCCQDIDISIGTFSKVFALTGGFVAADRDIIQYLKYFARPYMFSASLPPPTLAGVLAGLDLIEKEPSLREQLKHNVNYATKKLAHVEFFQAPEAAIISIKIPERIHIRKLNLFLHQKGLFLNAIEYPAVPKDQQRLRISIMANHTEDDLDFLSDSLEEAFHYKNCMKSSKC